MSAAPSPVAVFAALGDDTRWQILQRVGHQAASASALANELPVTRQAVARHLEVLHAAGLVERQRHGRELRYRAIGAALSVAAAELEQIAAGWDRRLARLRTRAESEG